MQRAVAILVLTLAAAVPHAVAGDTSGAWVYVARGSYWSNNDLPKEFSLTIDMKFSHDRLTYSSVNDTDKSKIGRLEFVAPLDGTVVPIENQPRYNQVSVRRTEDDGLEIIQYKDGDVIVGSFYTFLSDGKTLVRCGVGKAQDGKSKAYREYFVRK